METRRIL